MKIVIDIPEEMIQAAKTDLWCGSPTLCYAIKKSIPYEERPHGEWVEDRAYYKCPFCSNVVFKNNGKPYFCDHCGAAMTKEANT